MEMYQHHQHRLMLLNGNISLSKNGFVQGSRTVEPIAEKLVLDQAYDRLVEHYRLNGDDFLADASFVASILYS